MKHIAFLFLTFTLFCTHTVTAQDAISIPDTLQGWQTTWVVGINGSQASYSNWAQGGVNNIAGTGTSTFTSLYQKDRFAYGFLFDIRYGKTKIEDEGTRKIDDRLFIANRFLYNLSEDSDFNLFGKVTFRTQFDTGFRYGAGEDGGDVLISDFMAPAYFIENIGIAYIPNDIFSFEAGLGLQQTYVRHEELAETYGLDPGENFRSEAGFTLGAGVEANIAENVQYVSSIQTFTNVNRALSSTDLYFSNKIIGRINNYLNTNLSVDLVYDDDFSNELQVAQILSLGISFSLR